MTRDAPQWLLELGRREQEPAIYLSSLAEIRWKKTPVEVLLRQVEDDCNGLRKNQLPIDEHGNLSGGVYLKEGWALVFTCDQVDRNGVEIDPKLLKRPAHSNGSRRTELE
jgi:hypothetical protein